MDMWPVATEPYGSVLAEAADAQVTVSWFPYLGFLYDETHYVLTETLSMSDI